MDKQDLKKNKIQGICSILIYYYLYFAVPISLAIFNFKYSEWSTNNKLLFNIGYDIFLIIIIYLLNRKTIKKDFIDYKKNIKTYISKYIKYWFIALGLMVVSNMIVQTFTHNIAQNEQEVRQLFNSNPAFTFILSILLAPFLEECIYRLSIYKILYKHKKIFIIVSGLIFGGMHILGNVNNVFDILFIIPYGIPGAVFAYTLIKSNNIFVPTSLHVFNNTFALIMQLIAMKIL